METYLKISHYSFILFLNICFSSFAGASSFNSNLSLDLKANEEIYKQITPQKSFDDYVNHGLQFGAERGGGGDGVFCYKKDTKPKTLDYLLREKKIGIAKQYQNSSSCLENLKLISVQLKKNYPILGSGLDFYIDSLQSSLAGHFTHNRAFHFTNDNLVSLDDENLNTRDKEKLKQCELKQIGVRLPLPDLVHYSIHAPSFQKLQSDPLQCSYFLAHEWGRDLINDASQLRKFVHILHSGKLASLDKYFEEFSKLKNKPIPSDYSSRDYLEDIRSFGNLAYSNANFIERLNLFAGTYVPANNKDCKKELTVKGKTVSISHLIRCDSSQKIDFDCKGFSCEAKLQHNNCKDFRLALTLNGYFSNFQLSASCDGNKSNQSNEYFKEQFLELYKDLRSKNIIQ